MQSSSETSLTINIFVSISLWFIEVPELVDNWEYQLDVYDIDEVEKFVCCSGQQSAQWLSLLRLK